MSKPLLTLALSDDGNSIFVYRGGLDDTDRDFTGAPADTRELQATLGLQREDLEERVNLWVQTVLRDVFDDLSLED